MDPKFIVRAIAVALLAGTVLACAVEVGRLGRGSDPAETPSQDNQDNNDPLATELARCKALGAEAVNDAACKAAWAKSRERFLAPGAPYRGHRIDPFPAAPDAPPSKAPPKIFLDRAPPAPQPNAGNTPGTQSEGR